MTNVICVRNQNLQKRHSNQFWLKKLNFLSLVHNDVLRNKDEACEKFLMYKSEAENQLK